jgi:hypothetical protein
MGEKCIEQGEGFFAPTFCSFSLEILLKDRILSVKLNFLLVEWVHGLKTERSY